MDRSELDRDTIVALRRQLSGLQVELKTLSAEYEQALKRINELEAERFAWMSGETSARTAQIVAGLAAREQFYRRQAESFANTSRELEEEMQTAGSLQRLLVPDELPHDTPGVSLAASYASASKTSGDLYGVRHRPGHSELTLFIADATGHGLPAALLTAGISGAMQLLELLEDANRNMNAMLERGRVDTGRFRSVIQSLSEPAPLLAILDNVVGEMGRHDFGMTLFSACFNYARFRLRYANAGHCFPLLVRRGKAQSLHQSDARLGATTAGASRWRQHEVSIHDGDVLLLYTDGLVEAENTRGQVVGLRRLATWLETLHTQPADIIRDGIESRLAHFVGSRPVADDVTFLVVKFQR